MMQLIRAFFERRKLDPSYRNKIYALEKRIGLPIRNHELYLKALRHRSIIDEKKMAVSESYEQLEFLGDAVLDLIVSEYIFRKYPSSNEGFMTQTRSQLVNGEMLAEIGRCIRLMDYVELGNRVKNQDIEYLESVMADTFEALVGAVYKDHGYDTCRDYVIKLYQNYIDLEEITSIHNNFKSMFLEAIQAKKMPLPKYNVVRETGPGHEKVFDIEVQVGSNVMGTGTGRTKKKAEQAAAKAALMVLEQSQQ